MPRFASSSQTTMTAQPRLLSQINQRLVLRAVRENGPCTRPEVVRRTGVSAPTVAKAVAALLRAGILEEYDAPENTRGRPARTLRLATKSAQVVGLVIDSPNCRLVTAGLDGVITRESPIAFRTPRGYSRLLDEVVERVEALRGDNGARTLGVGISLPGLFDYREGRSLLSPNVPITNGRCPGRDLSKRLGVECVVLQESDALCLAERHYGQAGGLDDFAILDSSTGIGLGVLTGGRLLKGSRGLVGEIGHLPIQPNGPPCGCGRRGCLETLASDTALARLVSRRVGRRMDIERIVEQTRAGELSVRREVNYVCRRLSLALVTTLHLFNPTKLFVHSRIFDLDPTAFERLVSLTGQAALAPPFRDCTMERARGSKQEGAVAGIIDHLTDSRIDSRITVTHPYSAADSALPANGHDRRSRASAG